MTSYVELASRITDFPELYMGAYRTNYSDLISYVMNNVNPKNGHDNMSAIISEDFMNRLSCATLGALAWMCGNKILSAKETISLAQKMDECSITNLSDSRVITSELFTLMFNICNEFGSWIDMTESCIEDVNDENGPSYNIKALNKKFTFLPLKIRIKWSIFLHRANSDTNTIINSLIRETVKTLLEKYAPENDVRYRSPASGIYLKTLADLSETARKDVIAALETPGEALLYFNSILKANDRLYEAITSQCCHCLVDAVALRSKFLFSVPKKIAEMRLQKESQEEIINKLGNILPEYVQLTKNEVENTIGSAYTNEEFLSWIKNITEKIRKNFLETKECSATD